MNNILLDILDKSLTISFLFSVFASFITFILIFVVNRKYKIFYTIQLFLNLTVLYSDVYFSLLKNVDFISLSEIDWYLYNMKKANLVPYMNVFFHILLTIIFIYSIIVFINKKDISSKI